VSRLNLSYSVSMKSNLCHVCGLNLALVGNPHRCIPKSDGGGEQTRYSVKGLRTRKLRPIDLPEIIPIRVGEEAPSGPRVESRIEAAGVASSPSDAKREFRRPLAKDRDKTLSATKPWEADGMSRASWYRRQKESKT
jgi:hypothetical protein